MRLLRPLFTVTLLALTACVGEDFFGSSAGPGPAPTPPPSGDDAGADAGSPPPDGDDAGARDGGSGPVDGVEGNVVDLGATPVANATVRIGALTTTTDASGQFKLAGVKVPFDVDVVSPLDPSADGTTKFVLSVRGVTSRTPILHVRHTGPERRATASGTTNLTFSGNNQRLKWGFVNPTGLPNAVTTPSLKVVDAETYESQVTWQGRPNAMGVWYFIHFVGGSITTTQASSFTGIQRIAGTLNDAGSATVAPMSTKPAGTGTIAGPIAFPAEAKERLVTVGARLDPADRAGLMYGSYAFNPIQTTYSVTAPTGPNVSALVIGSAKSPNAGGVAGQTQVQVWANVASSTPNLPIAFPSAPSITSPAQGAPMEVTATFAWTGGTAPYRLDVDCRGYKASIVTMKNDASLPAGLGAWPEATACTATVTSYGHVTAIDPYVAADAPYAITSPWASNGTMATTTNAFTTSP